MDPIYDETTSRRLKREDGSLGPPQLAPWNKWTVLSRADKISAVLAAVGILFTAIPLYGGPLEAGRSTAYNVIAPLMGVVFFIAQLAQFLERDNRHGLVRALLVVASAVLAISGVVFARQAPPGAVLLGYWTPAVLGLLAAMALQKAHLKVGDRVRIPHRKHD
jgi:hypothetical protein